MDVLIEQLTRLEQREGASTRGLLAYAVRGWLTASSTPNVVLHDQRLQGLFDDARLAVDCGWPVGPAVPAVPTVPTAPATVSEVIMYVDGSCLSNGKSAARAGFGVYITRPDHTAFYSYSEALGVDEPQTNQRAELRALAWALNYVDEHGALRAVIYTDSKYALDCLQTWCAGWASSGWLKSDKKPVLHRDIIEPLYEAWCGLRERVTLTHVRGHSGGKDTISLGNAQADLLARGAAGATP